MDQFYKDLTNFKFQITQILKDHSSGNKVFSSAYCKIDMSGMQELEFQHASHCHICEKPFTIDDVRVRDHDHFIATNNYRGAAHEACNLNLNWNRYVIPVYFHNLRGYDSHLIIEALEKRKLAYIDKHGEEKCSKISVIANNLEKFMCFSFAGYQFIDSLQHLSASLDALASNLPKDSLAITKNQMTSNFDVACKKGIFPYEWMDSVEKLNATELPPIEAFYSNLREDGVSESDYQYAKTVWNLLNMRTMKDYMLFYLKTDVVLLADVFENYRNTMLTSHKLDPAYYVTSPGFSWDAFLYNLYQRKDGVNSLDCLTDYDMLMFFEKGIRGGMCVVSKRKATANNKHLSNFDATKSSNYIAYVDANNLYGSAMSQYLPHSKFEWNNNKFTKEQLNSIPEILLNNNTIGYTLEVDLTCPTNFEYFNDFPMAPENLLVQEQWLGDFQKTGLKDDQGRVKLDKCPKLLATMQPKINYVVHAANLVYYIQKGFRVTQVHRIVQYKQAPFLEPYIKLNNEFRKVAKNDFEKDLYKLLNNSVYGKTMENIRNRIDCEVIVDAARAKKVNASPLIDRFVVINENLTVVQRPAKEEDQDPIQQTNLHRSSRSRLVKTSHVPLSLRRHETKVWIEC